MTDSKPNKNISSDDKKISLERKDSTATLLKKCKVMCEEVQIKIKSIQMHYSKTCPNTLKEHSEQAQIKKDTKHNSAPRCRKELKGHYGKIYCLATNESGDIATGGQDEKIIVWNSISGFKREVISVGHNSVMAVGFSPDDSLLAGGGLDNVCSVFHRDDYQTVKCELVEHQGYVSQCRFLSNFEIITASGDGTCILWDIETRSVKSCFKGHKADVIGVDSMNETINTKHQSLVLTGSIDKTVKLWDCRVTKKNLVSEIDHSGSTDYGSGSDNCVMTFHGHENDVNTVKWFPSYNYTFASGSMDGSVRLWDLRSMGQLNLFDYTTVDKNKQLPTPPAISSIDFSKSGYLLFAGYDDYPHCVAWNTMSAMPFGVMPHVDAVSSVALTKDGCGIVTGSWDMVARVWA